MTTSDIPTPENFWQAICARDPAFDGVFFYGVRSTGVFCKPSCPSRQPRRAQVVYFANQDAAVKAGFRACKRCQPNTTISHIDALVARIQTHLDQLPDRMSLKVLGVQFGLSPSYLQKIFKSRTGLSPSRYAAAKRLERFKIAAAKSEDVTEAQYAAGYRSVRSLYQQAARQLGMTPSTYQHGGQGMEIRYTFLSSRLGQILVAATERGLCAVRLGDNQESLEELLAREFPAAHRIATTSGLETWLQMLQDYLDGKPMPADINLDLQATTFQLRVWEALRSIPYGRTVSYGQLAAEIGQPKAVRAVAQACAANPIALVTPCHRVVRSDGSLGGYRWGIERKQMLLTQEKS